MNWEYEKVRKRVLVRNQNQGDFTLVSDSWTDTPYDKPVKLSASIHWRRKNFLHSIGMERRTQEVMRGTILREEKRAQWNTGIRLEAVLRTNLGVDFEGEWIGSFLRSGSGSNSGNHSQVLALKNQFILRNYFSPLINFKFFVRKTHFIAKKVWAICPLNNRFTNWWGTGEVGVTRHNMIEIYRKWSNCFEEKNAFSHGQSCFERLMLLWKILTKMIQRTSCCCIHCFNIDDFHLSILLSID